MLLGLLAGATPCAAEPAGGSETVRLELAGVIAARCGFVGSSPALSVELPNGPSASGTLAFSCNLPGATPVTVRLSSDHGGLKREGNDTVLPYAVHWRMPGDPDHAFLSANQSATFHVPSGTAGSIRHGTLTMELLDDPAGLPAGSYTDYITYTIVP